MKEFEGSNRHVLCLDAETRAAIDILKYNHVKVASLLRGFLIAEAAKYSTRVTTTVITTTTLAPITREETK